MRPAASDQKYQGFSYAPSPGNPPGTNLFEERKDRTIRISYNQMFPLKLMMAASPYFVTVLWRSVDWLIDWLIDCLFCRLFDCLICYCACLFFVLAVYVMLYLQVNGFKAPKDHNSLRGAEHRCTIPIRPLDSAMLRVRISHPHSKHRSWTFVALHYLRFLPYQCKIHRCRLISIRYLFIRYSPYSIEQMNEHETDWGHVRLIGWLNEWIICRLLIDWLIDRLVYVCAFDGSIDWLID